MIVHPPSAGMGRRHQRGVGLIEVLIAVLVVSIGFLGLAALQAFSLSTNNSAMARSMATVSTYSILDAMRVDRDNALNGSYNGTVAADACPDAAGTLSSQQLNQWCMALGHNLGAVPSTTGDILCTAAGQCTITITFDDSRAGDGVGSNAHQVITKVAI